ncbi:peptidyl-prolyl cis-trans isomerase D [Desulfurobacterium pacificum]|uniref:Peptidyl-prolyl cis-trans isomerase D n=1 Tax=Desulfurobacterium pacificum TaxID=240166 RepID=A0ABY1NJ47_9BACT|nr:SurA N-terminal domain-containing protein [Desulfurobacterium pacificum]SMP11029.1 peptidyl-prolyl cis-trans isomerase D [Desulfurobacterium pacificum]
MLSKIRNNLRTFSIFLWVVAASFVGTIFLVWGKGSISGPSANEVATVNGLGINLVEFNREYNRVLEELKQQYGNQYRKFLTDKDIKLLALRNLIRRKLILSETEKEGIRVSDWAVAKEIESMPIFQKNGKFDVNLYKKVLAANHLTPEQFESEIRDDLLVSKVTSVVGYSPSVTKFELNKLYKEMFGKRKFKFKLFGLNTDNVTVSEDELKSYYEKHKSEFAGNATEKYFVVEIPVSESGATEKAAKAFKLAKSGDFSALNGFNPKEVPPGKAKKLMGDKAVYFTKDSKFFYVYYRAKTSESLPFEKVKSQIEKVLKEQKAFEVAKKLAENFVKSNGALENATDFLDREEFAKKFKPVNPADVERAFTAKVGEKLIVPVVDGFVVVSPETEITVTQVEPKKEEQLRAYILAVKRKSNEVNFLNLLQQKATIKINKELLRLQQ